MLTRPGPPTRMPYLVLDGGSTGSRLKCLQGEQGTQHVTDIGQTYGPIQQLISESTADLASQFYQDIAASGMTGRVTIFVGLTGGVRAFITSQRKKAAAEWIAGLRSALRQLRTHLSDLRTKTLRVDLRFPPAGTLTAEQESQCEHSAMLYALRHCNPVLWRSLTTGNAAVAHVGHIGVGGASIQLTSAPRRASGRSAAPADVSHVLIPFSFTIDKAVQKTRRFLRQPHIQRFPRGAYLAIESCYWLMKEMYDIKDEHDENGRRHYDVALEVSRLDADLAHYISVAEQRQWDARNIVTAKMLRLIFKRVFTPDSYVVVMGHDYCGGEVTWPLGWLTDPACQTAAAQQSRRRRRRRRHRQSASRPSGRARASSGRARASSARSLRQATTSS